MTNKQKSELRSLAKDGLSFKEIRDYVYCSDSTIRQYIRIFRFLKKRRVPNDRKGS